MTWTNGRREDAEDALGEVALIALQKLPGGFGPEESLKWLSCLTYHKCMDIHRKHRRAQSLVLDSQSEAVVPSLESTAVENEAYAFARSSILALPSRLREVAELRLLRDLEYAEIAAALNLSEVNVRKRMQQARMRLRETLESFLAGSLDLREAEEAGRAERSHRAPVEHPQRRWSIASLEKYVRAHPRGWKKAWELARRLRDAGRHEEAIDHFRRAAARQPRVIALQLDLAGALKIHGPAVGNVIETNREGNGEMRDIENLIEAGGRQE